MPKIMNITVDEELRVKSDTFKRKLFRICIMNQILMEIRCLLNGLMR
jgi:hypothetical protein